MTLSTLYGDMLTVTCVQLDLTTVRPDRISVSLPIWYVSHGASSNHQQKYWLEMVSLLRHPRVRYGDRHPVLLPGHLGCTS